VLAINVNDFDVVFSTPAELVATDVGGCIGGEDGA